jgi:glycosyltransferase involved in cell wall biosynthesis
MKPPFRLLLLMRGGVEWVGGAEYIRNLVLALEGLPEVRAGEVELNLLASRGGAGWAVQGLAKHVHRTYYVEDELGAPGVLQKIRARLGRRRRVYVPDLRYDQFFDRCAFDFVYPYLGGRGRSARSAAWIPDFQHKLLPQYFGPEEIASLDQLFTAVATQAPLVVLSSQDAAAHFAEHYPNASAERRVLPFRAVPDGAWYESDADAVRRKYHLPERFFLMCNQFWKHKNHLVVFDALRLLGERGARPVVVCTGPLHDYRNPQYSSEILQRIQLSDLSGQVRLLGLVPKLEQIQLMRQSLAVIQPSLFEGWSTVVEEVRCFGKIVLLSDIPVHREQAPPGARYFDPASASELAALLGAAWGSTAAGRNAEQEALARAAQGEHVETFARTFMSLARGVH